MCIIWSQRTLRKLIFPEIPFLRKKHILNCWRISFRNFFHGYEYNKQTFLFLFFNFFSFIFISWRLITLQYCSGFCHTLTWISHGFTCVPHPDPPCHLPLYLIPLGLPSVTGPSTCLMHPTWAGDLKQTFLK